MMRLMALLAALVMLAAPAAAQEEERTFTLSTGHIVNSAAVHETVEALFAAAAGTTLEAETEARKALDKALWPERDALNAAHRAKTLPWLIEAFRPEEEPLPGVTPTPAPTPALEPVWTLEDGYAAIAATEPGRAYLTLLAPYGAADAGSAMDVTREFCAAWLEEIDHEKLAEINGDYACWIYAAGTKIDYPVVQTENNTYYLDHLFSKARNAAGTLFIDYRNLPDFQDPNTLIYGHHMRNNTMLGSLTDYYDPGFFDAHPFMLLVTPKEIAVVQLFAAYVTDGDDHCYDMALSDEDDMRYFVERAKRKSDFDSGVEVDVYDRLVTLSTCAYVFDGARYVAIGRLEPVWQAKEEAVSAGDLP